MAPVKVKTASKTPTPTNRQTRAKYNALPENLPGLKTRSGKQIVSPKVVRDSLLNTGKLHVSTSRSSRTVKNKNDFNSKPKLDVKIADNPKKKPKTNLRSPEKTMGRKDIVKKVENGKDSDTQRNRSSSNMRELDTSNSPRPQRIKKIPSKLEKTEMKKSPKKNVKVGTAESVKQKITSKSGTDESRKADKHKLTEHVPIQEAKKPKIAAAETLSPRRSSRAIIPNRKFKDMEVEWNLASVKKEPVPIAVEDIQAEVESREKDTETKTDEVPVPIQEIKEEKKEEKKLKKAIEINSFSPGNIIKVTVPYSGKRRPKPKPKIKKPFPMPEGVIQKEPEEPEETETKAREVKDYYQVMKIHPPETVLQQSTDLDKMALKPNNILKIHPVATSIKSETPDITIIKAPEKSATSTPKKAATTFDNEMSEQEYYSDEYSGDEVREFLGDSFIESDHSSVMETSNSSPYNSDREDMQNISKDTEIPEMIIVQDENEDASEMGNSEEQLTIDLGSDKVEVCEVTEFCRKSPDKSESKSSDIQDRDGDNETEEISEILNRLTNTIEIAVQAESAKESSSPEKASLPYRVIPIQNLQSKAFSKTASAALSLKRNVDDEKSENKTPPTSLMSISPPLTKPVSSLTKTTLTPRILPNRSERGNKELQPGTILVLNDKSASNEKQLQTRCGSGIQERDVLLSLNGKVLSKDIENESFDTSSNNDSDIVQRIIESRDDSDSNFSSDLPNSKSTSISTQTPIIDKNDCPVIVQGDSSKSQLKTKTISVNVQKPGEELQIKDGEVTAEAQKQEFIIVHLPEGTTIKNYTVQSRSKLEDDIAFTQDENGQFFCGECSYSTMKKANWYKHKRRHLGQLVKTHACNYCSYRASTSSNLKRHLSIHADIRMFKCGICDLTFRQKIHLERHIKYRHEVKQVKCPLCDYICANENPDLKVHIKRKHLHSDGSGESVQAFACSECGLTTLSRKDLKQHQKFHRKGPELKLFCAHCSFVTDCESRLKRHMFIHTKEKPFECSLCEYRGSQKEHVLRHMRAQHSIDIPRQSRKSHNDSTSNEDSNDGKDVEKNKADYSSQEKIFACNHCSMKFAKLINLYKHLHSQHKDIMPYEGDTFQCVVCDFTTNNKKNLLVHMRRHNLQDQSPPSHVYSCVLCRYMNPKRRNLFQHMKKKHGIDIVMRDDGSANCFVTENNPVVVGSDDSNITNIGNIFAATDGDSPLQIVTDDSVSTSAQNVITIQELAYAVSNPQIINDNNVVIVEQDEEGNNIQLNTLVQHEAAEAIEGLQALAEQPGIFEMQTVIEEPAIVDNIEENVETSEEDLQNIVDSTETKFEVIENDGILAAVAEGDQKIISEADILQESAVEKDSGNGIQLSEEQLMHLSSGDYVEINGEMYKVEIRTDESARIDNTAAVEEMVTINTEAIIETPATDDMEEVINDPIEAQEEMAMVIDTSSAINNISLTNTESIDGTASVVDNPGMEIDSAAENSSTIVTESTPVDLPASEVIEEIVT